MARLVAIAVLGVLVAPAAASAVTPPTFQYTGQLQGSRAFVGIVNKGDRFRAYVSDATPKRATLSVWFSATTACGDAPASPGLDSTEA
jgi:hypothetical protein